jgi:BolA protein
MGKAVSMSVADALRAKLTAAFAPQRLDVYDESHLHHGHAGSPGTGESHFRVVIVTSAFQGLSRVDRHRKINDALADELRNKVHALTLMALTPDEAAKRM